MVHSLSSGVMVRPVILQSECDGSLNGQSVMVRLVVSMTQPNLYAVLVSFKMRWLICYIAGYDIIAKCQFTIS